MTAKTTFVRLARGLLLIGLLIAVAWILTRAPLPVAHASTAPQPVQQGQVVGEGSNQAALVVRYEDGSVQTRCVAFSEADIGGDELLERSGLAPVIAPEGAVCSINGIGCPSDDCFCQCPFPDCEYWAYYHWQDGAWSYSNIGAFSYAVTNGALEGWSWGQGDFAQGVEPPVIPFEQICLATTGADDTPTPTPTATTQVVVPVNPPQVTFQAAASSIVSGQCTALSWQTIDATSVTLNGISVELQGSRQECPTTSQAWTLVAVNGAGQTTRQVALQVTAGAAATLTPMFTTSPVVAGSRSAMPTSAVAPIITQAPRPLPVTVPPQPGAAILQTPAPGTDLIGGVPFAPTAEPLAAVTLPPQPTATRFVFSLPPTETPRPRRILGADGRPTPTPILLARVPAAPSGGEPAQKDHAGPATVSDAARQLAESRSFSPRLLPGYAAYILTLAILAVIGWYVLRRKNGHRVAPARELTQDDRRLSHEVHGRGHEQAAQEP